MVSTVRHAVLVTYGERAGRWQIEVDRHLCVGTGLCAGMVPARFRLVDGVSQPVDGVVDPDDDVLAAAEACPTEAIAVLDAADRRLIAPEE